MQSGFYRKLENPSGLAVLDCCLYHPDGVKPAGFIITRINVPFRHRGKGIARELLRECCAQADVEKTTLWLEIQPSDGLDFYELEAWYKRNGFKWINGQPFTVMRRKPQ